jgi:hypothetical protein
MPAVLLVMMTDPLLRLARWVVVAALLLTGCQAPAGQTEQQASEEPTVEDVRLAATLKQYRADQARRVVQVGVANEGTEPVRIEQLRLDARGFAPIDPTPKDTELEPGRRVDLPITFGEARCGDGPPYSAGAATVPMRVAVGDGPAQDVRLELEAPNELLDRLLSAECEQRALAEAMSIEFGPSWELDTTEGQERLRGSVVLRRLSSTEPLAVSQIAGSVILGIQPVPPRPAPLLALDPAATSAELPVEIVASRCDPHALSDSKRTFVFPTWVTVDGGPEQYTTIALSDDGRQRMDELITAGCDLG